MSASDQSGPFARVPARSVPIDRPALLTWIDEHSREGSGVRMAVYSGLAARIRRGQFNEAADGDQEADS